MSGLFEQLSGAAASVGRASIQACLLIVFILLAQALLRDRMSAGWRFALWSLLLVRLALPWTPESAISAYNLLPGIAKTAPAPSRTPVQIQNDTSDFRDGHHEVAVAQSAPAGTPVDTPVAPVASVSPAEKRPSTSIWTWLTIVWVTGALLVLASAAVQSFGMARAVRRRRFVTDQDTLNLLEDCKEASGIHAYIAMAETDRVTSPALFGIIRPRLLLPPGTVSSLNREQLRHVFLHELAHLKRGDIAINWVMTVLQAIHWFNPLVWYAFARMRADRELACDALALSHARPEESREYGRTFIFLLEKYAQPRRVPALAGVMESHDHMKRRIAMIARFNPAAAPRPVIAVALMVLLGGVCLTNARSEVDRDKAEMMGRVDDFFMHNFRDVTSRKSLEWGDIVTSGTDKSIRYMFEAKIWDKKTLIMNQVFTFAADGKFVKYEDVAGYPRPKEVANPATKEGIQKLVENFFDNNYRDITARETVEWGDLVKTPEGNYSIRYKFNATIWDKDKKVMEQVFTFTPEGKFVSAKDLQSANGSGGMGGLGGGGGMNGGRADFVPATSTISPDGRIVDKIDVAFEDDAAAIGTWKSVDFVENAENFQAGMKVWKGDLLLKELQLLPGGKTPKPWETWTKGLLLHQGDKTASEYTIKDVNGTPYMFLQWKSGDYSQHHQRPWYYVLKKG